MRLRNLINWVLVVAVILLIPIIAFADDTFNPGVNTVRDTGVSGIWILSNISYAGMQAQNSPNTGWRIIAFIFGLPGTIISFLTIKEGEERAYGIDLPRRKG